MLVPYLRLLIYVLGMLKFGFAVVYAGPSPMGSSLPNTLFSDISYHSSVPTLKSVLGYQPGEQISRPEQILAYMRALEKHRPENIKIFTYGRTWQGRELVYAVISSKQNLLRLDAFKANMAKLAAVEQTQNKAQLLADQPIPVWLGYGVHGDEISSSDAALLLAYHLLAAKNDVVVDSILADTLVLIDPLQNPDGRNRFLQSFYNNMGLKADPHPLAAEHNQLWPGGRVNHYLFDMNRDWFALTQPETQAKIKVFMDWYPVIVADVHEMGTNETYYFPPAAKPHSPLLNQTQKDNLRMLGENHSKWFDRYGIDYFTGEIFDAYYPGYGDSWFSYHGAMASTFEQASAEGLKIYRKDNSVLTYQEGVRNHFLSSLSTLELSGKKRKKLLKDFVAYRKKAMQEAAAGSVKTYIFPYQGDKGSIDKLAAVLVRQGIRVKQAKNSFSACKKTFPAYSYVVPTEQPAYKLLTNLLADNIPLDKNFLKEQERLRSKKLEHQLYDVTAWSLALMYNIKTVSCNQRVSVNLTDASDAFIKPGRIDKNRASVAYISPWGNTATARLLSNALQQDIRVWSAGKAFTINNHKFPAGSLIFKVADNDGQLYKKLTVLVEETGAEVFSFDHSWVNKGINLGSRHVKKIPKIKIALAWDWPTSPYSAGAARYVLERQFNYPVSVVRTHQLSKTDLNDFDVLILPSTGKASYKGALGESADKRLRRWVLEGGVLIAIESAIDYIANKDVALLDTKREALPSKSKSRKTQGDAKSKNAKLDRVTGKLIKNETEYKHLIKPSKPWPDSIPGVLLKANTDQDHWLSAGIAESLNVLLKGSRIFTPLTLDKGVNVAYWSDAESLLQGGYLWQENKEQLAYKPFVMLQEHGEGYVIGFTADPNYRAYSDGLNLLFINAIFTTAAHVR